MTYDFESLCGESTFRNALVEVYDSVKDRLGVGSNFSQQLVILRDLIDDRLTAKP